MRKIFVLVFLLYCTSLLAQPPKGYNWSKDGNAYYAYEDDAIVQYALPSFTKIIIASNTKLVPKDSSKALAVRNFFFSQDGRKILIYTNSKKVWRYDTRGDYWVLNLADNSLFK